MVDLCVCEIRSGYVLGNVLRDTVGKDALQQCQDFSVFSHRALRQLLENDLYLHSMQSDRICFMEKEDFQLLE